MKISMYQIDAFTKTLFGGNPAAICHLPNWLDDQTLQNIAVENNLAETGFFVKKSNIYEIRWFMPHAEIDLCGHATLASAYVIFNYIDSSIDEITFSSKSGILKAKKENTGAITLDFPSRPPEPIEIPSQIHQALNAKPIATFAARDLVITLSSEEEVLNENPNLDLLKNLPYLCIIITAEGKHVDFVSRVFDANGIIQPEDPVTGSAHTSLVPLWAKKLGKNNLKAQQLSARRGELDCKLDENRVFLSGYSVPYLIGEIEI
ncbi:PhzF family phenazine biosynthesis protein [Aquimarina sp. MAR_2010_214]|uniref:PhzF family phenazine biosynthesis protein n=1 Tax=Aquimarina sp. MAR_2010_214 TaxID=1250026 RepID=UPI000C70E07F|nr:PhzF family phenazine biosynthesis protein [Aquimarina sp. MAR_2010_214]PKV51233.1 PhzF family phenazine biosynthesis protein [Aquimarina sp. MAR_2010_214]